MKTIVRYKWIPVLFALLAMTVACQNDVFNDAIYSNRTINLQAQITQGYETRAHDNGFADGDKIGVFVVNYNGNDAPALEATGNHADNILFTYDDKSGSWNGSTQLYWKDDTTPIDLYGYYPFDPFLKEVSAYSFVVQRNQRDALQEGTMKNYSGYEASDFLWSKMEKVYPTEAAIILKYYHLLAGVKVSLLKGEGFTKDEWERLSKTVLIENTRIGVTIDLEDGTTTVNENSAVTTIIPQTHNDEYRAIVVPQEVEANKELFSITVDGQSYHFARGEKMTYISGKLHNFTITVNKKTTTGDYEFKLSSEVITKWENDPLSHNGTAREYITVHVEEDEYIGDVISRMELNPKEIINLKLTGTLTGKSQFSYIRGQMSNLEAINMRDLRTKQQEVIEAWKDDTPITQYGFEKITDDYLPHDAFKGMEFLSYVVWPDNLKGIGYTAFAGCNLRGSLILPEGLEFIGKDAFFSYEYRYQISPLSGELYIPTTVEYIGDYAFGGYDNIGLNLTGELVLPGQMKYLGEKAFGACKYLIGKLRIPDGLTEVNDAWFLTGVTGFAVVPQGVKKINGIGCLISGVHIPEGVEEIKNIHTGDVNAFANRYGESAMSKFLLNDIHLPSTVTTLQEYAFKRANSARVHLSEGLEIIPRAAFEQSGLQDTLTIPNSVTQIQPYAFNECKMLTAIVLPGSLKEIQTSAFQNCHSLNYIQCLNPEPPVLNASAFNGVEKNNITLVVPEGSVDSYKSASGWSEFTRISTDYNFVCRPMGAKLLNKGHEMEIILNADGAWTVTSIPDWVSISSQSGNQKTSLKVQISDLVNGENNREGEIVFTLSDRKDDRGNAITTSYKITQYDSEYKENSQIKLQSASKGNGINIVFTADGYDAEDISDGSFMNDIKEGMEYFFGIEPYKTYKDYFNVYADVAMSYDSGVCSNVNIWRNTKFNTIYGAGDNGRLKVDAAAVWSFTLKDVEESVINESNLSESLIICILNSDDYEGICFMSLSGAAVAFVPHSRWEYPNDYRGIIQHEAGGHGFGKLGDEYVYHKAHIENCTCSCCNHLGELVSCKMYGWYPNLSISGKYSEIEWKHLIFDARYDDIVDIYEGGFYHAKGVYRSEVNSCMNDNVPYYNTISRQVIVERIMKLAGETFDYETFVSNDNCEMGDKFLSRQGGGDVLKGSPSQNPPPIIYKGSPMDYIRQYKNKTSK